VPFEVLTAVLTNIQASWHRVTDVRQERVAPASRSRSAGRNRRRYASG
jgi:hypothetical protein